MPLLQWHDTYSVNNELIDGQHKVLFELFGKLYDICMSKENDVAYGSVVDELYAYAADHFRTEQIHMSEMHYPGFQQHLQQHDEFTRKIVELKSVSESDDELCLDLVVHVASWIYDHVIAEDKKFAEYGACER